MSALAKTLERSGRITLGYGETLLAGIEPAQFARFAHVAGEVIRSNHPAFCYGHLSIYPARILAMMDRDPGAAANPEGFEELFSATAECRDDPDGSIYPDHETIVRHYKRAYNTVLSIIGELTDKELTTPMTIDRWKERFPTFADAIGFLVGPHAMLHHGQVSAWRRMVGLGPAM